MPHHSSASPQTNAAAANCWPERGEHAPLNRSLAVSDVISTLYSEQLPKISHCQLCQIRRTLKHSCAGIFPPRECFRCLIHFTSSIPVSEINGPGVAGLGQVKGRKQPFAEGRRQKNTTIESGCTASYSVDEFFRLITEKLANLLARIALRYSAIWEKTNLPRYSFRVSLFMKFPSFQREHSRLSSVISLFQIHLFHSLRQQ